ncbi:MAG: hypothetical protein OXI34_11270 [Chloroflexota bacterium]|nr:hypothetical protein [Chloroflexota bacterium]MDE2948942.1 hypothetical protein [Chloroflexota bacterium]
MSEQLSTWQLARELLDTIAVKRQEYLTRLAEFMATQQSMDASATRQQLAHKLPNVADVSRDRELASALSKVIGESVIQALTYALLSELNSALAQTDLTQLPAERLEEIALDVDRPGGISASFYQLLKEGVHGCAGPALVHGNKISHAESTHDIYRQLAAKLVREIELESFRTMPHDQFVDLTFGSLPDLTLDMVRDRRAETAQSLE